MFLPVGRSIMTIMAIIVGAAILVALISLAFTAGKIVGWHARDHFEQIVTHYDPDRVVHLSARNPR